MTKNKYDKGLTQSTTGNQPGNYFHYEFAGKVVCHLLGAYCMTLDKATLAVVHKSDWLLAGEAKTAAEANKQLPPASKDRG